LKWLADFYGGGGGGSRSGDFFSQYAEFANNITTKRVIDFTGFTFSSLGALKYTASSKLMNGWWIGKNGKLYSTVLLTGKGNSWMYQISADMAKVDAASAKYLGSFLGLASASISFWQMFNSTTTSEKVEHFLDGGMSLYGAFGGTPGLIAASYYNFFAKPCYPLIWQSMQSEAIWRAGAYQSSNLGGLTVHPGRK